jgi:hypothetical protein
VTRTATLVTPPQSTQVTGPLPSERLSDGRVGLCERVCSAERSHKVVISCVRIGDKLWVLKLKPWLDTRGVA